MASRAGIKLGQRVTDKLTDKKVREAKPPAQGQTYLSDGKGLYLRVSGGGAKSWVFRYRVDGTAKLWEMGLGSARLAEGDGGVPLYEVRKRAGNLRDQLREYREGLTDQHPLAAKAAAKVARRVEAAKAITFRECAEAYIAAHRAGWRSARHAAQWPESLAAYVYPLLGDLPVQSIDMALVMKVLEQGSPPFWQAHPTTANRVRSRIESVLDWATSRGYRHGENPARWRGHLDNQLPKPGKVRPRKNYDALPYRDVPEFITALRAQGDTAALALEFIILTAARIGEVVGARWSEINLTERVWTVPAERMKSGREHRVPLSGAAMTILAQLDPDTGLVFPGTGRGMLSRETLRHRLAGRKATVHGFRSTFTDWAAEQTAAPFELREMALAHAVGDTVVRAYQRTDLFDKRRQLAEAWARFATGQGGEVVPLVRQG